MNNSCGHDERYTDTADDGTAHCVYCRALAAEAEIKRLQTERAELVEFIRYWSHCTRVAMNERCPEENKAWTESMRRLCPGGLVEHAVNAIHDIVAAQAAEGDER